MATHNGGNGKSERLARTLGWFSIGLGLAESVAPREMARLIGMNDTHKNRNLLRGFGRREIAAGVGILAQRRPAGWMWARVGGDALDLATVGASVGSSPQQRERAAGAVAGVTALDILCAQQLSAEP